MNKYFKEFLRRGMMFGGFGPIILGIIYVILQRTNINFSLTGGEVLTGIISIYLLAFIQAGASVFNGIEHWSLPKSLLCHFVTLFLAYSLCYICNRWIPFEPKVLLIFTVIFTVAYFSIWFTVFLILKLTAKRINSRLN